MSRRGTSLNNKTGTAITREIDSKYDNVKVVAANISVIEAIATAIEDGTLDSSDLLVEEPLKSAVLTVAGISGDISTVAAIEADIGSVALNETDISTVATSIEDVNTVADNIDGIETVADAMSSVEAVHAAIADIESVASNMSTILDAVDVISNLTASASTVDYGESASAELDGSNIHIEVPRGLPGANGANGLTPIVTIEFDEESGDLTYNVAYETTPGTSTEGEW